MNEEAAQGDPVERLIARMRLSAIIPEAGPDETRFLVDVLPTAVYVTDASGRITYYNEAAATLWGYRPKLKTTTWCGSWRLYWADGTSLSHAESPMAQAIKDGRALRGLEIVIERPDGTRLPLMPYPTPLFDQGGRLIGAVNLLIDISGQKLANEQAYRLAAIVESSDDAIVSKDLDGYITSWNGGAQRLFGYPPEEAIGRSILILIPADRHDEENFILQRIRRGEHVDHLETVRRHKDGSLVDIAVSVSPIRDATGRLIGASKIARNIGERKRALEQQRLLVNEMRHRVKNVLTIVEAIAAQTLRHSPAEEKDAFSGRLRALALAQDLLSQDNWKSASLREIVARAMAPFRGKHRDQIRTDGTGDLWLPGAKVALLAMGLHELATNAAKYGALSCPAGVVTLTWNVPMIDAAARLHLQWRETGGPRVRESSRHGFGMRLLQQALAAELGEVRITFEPEGLVCTLDLGV